MCLGREEVEAFVLVYLQKLREIIVVGDIELVPIVKPGAFKLSVVYFKAHRSYQMKRRAGYGAGSGNVARVLRYFGLDKNEVKISHFMYPFAKSEKYFGQNGVRNVKALFGEKNPAVFPFYKTVFNELLEAF